MDLSHVYVRAWALCCFHTLNQYPNLSEGADRVGGQLRGDKECPFSGVTKSGRVWRKVPESGARSVKPTTCSAGSAARCAAPSRLHLFLAADQPLVPAALPNPYYTSVSGVV